MLNFYEIFSWDEILAEFARQTGGHFWKLATKPNWRLGEGEMHFNLKASCRHRQKLRFVVVQLKQMFVLLFNCTFYSFHCTAPFVNTVYVFGGIYASQFLLWYLLNVCQYP